VLLKVLCAFDSDRLHAAIARPKRSLFAERVPVSVRRRPPSRNWFRPGDVEAKFLVTAM